MSTYEQLSTTVDKLVEQSIIADLRCASVGNAGWNVDDDDNPTKVTWMESQVGTWGESTSAVTLNWSDGSVVSAPGVGDGSEESTVFLQTKSKWEKAIPPLFDRFLNLPEPSKFASESTGLDTTITTLNGGGFTVGETEFDGTDMTYKLWQVGSPVETAKLNDWSGPAATTFRDQYIKTWPRNLSNQCSAASLMKLCIEREEKLWTKTREQIALTADHAVAAMKAADGPETDSAVPLAIFSAVAGVASFALPVVGQVALTTIVGGLGIVSAAADQREKKTMEFSAGTPDEVFAKLDQGLTDFSGEVWDAEYLVYSDMHALQEMLHKRTAFIGTGADDLVGSTDPYDVGMKGDSFEVSEVENLRTFAQLCIDASGDAKNAAGACTIDNPSGTRTRSLSLGVGGDGAADQYANCAAMLQDIIADNGITIGDAGAQLDAAANTYLTTDEDSHRTMQNRTHDLTKMREDDGDMPKPPPPPPHMQGGRVMGPI